MSYNYKICGEIKLFFDDREIACRAFNTKVQRNKIIAMWERQMLCKMAKTNAYYQITLFDEVISHMTKKLERVYEKKIPVFKRAPTAYSNTQWNEL